MKEIKKYSPELGYDEDDYRIAEMVEYSNGEYVKYSDVEQLQARIKELESEKHINEIKAQGVEEFIEIETNKSIKAGNSEIFRSYTMVRRRLCVFLNKLRTNHD